MKHSRSSASENESAGNMRSFSIQLPVRVADWIERTAQGRDKTAEQFLDELLGETVRDRTEPLEVRLRRINVLIKEMVFLAKKTPLQEEKDAKTGKPAFEGRKKRRDHLVELGMEAYDELRKISGSEQAAKEAEFRLQAFTVMARVGLFNAAVIRDQEAEDIAKLIEELEEENARIDAKIKEMEEKRREEEEKERSRANI